MLMLTKDADKKREQIQLFCMDDMVPQDHLLRIIDKAITGLLYMNWWRKNILQTKVVQVWTQ